MNFQIALENMKKQQLRTNNILNEDILALYDKVPRHEFVPNPYQAVAYSDMQIPLEHNQVMMTPLEECLTLQALKLTGKETVLEVGTGTGFLTALLNNLAKRVISVDCFASFTEHAQKKLDYLGCDGVELHTADAINGWYDNAPYDVIVVSGAIMNVSETLKLQVIPGGKLFTIVGKGKIMEARMYEFDHNGGYSQKIIYETKLPSLIDKTKPKEFIF